MNNNKRNEVICEVCEETFEVKLMVQELGGGVVRTFFTCPECTIEYDVAFSTRETRELQHDIRKLLTLAQAADSPEEKRELYLEYQDRREALREIMDDLKLELGE